MAWCHHPPLPYAMCVRVCPPPELPAQHGGSPVREVQTGLLRRCHQGHGHRLSPLSLSLHRAFSQVGATPPGRHQPPPPPLPPANITAPVSPAPLSPSSPSPPGFRSRAFWTRTAKPPATPAHPVTPAAAARGGWVEGSPKHPPHLPNPKTPHPITPPPHPPHPIGAPQATRETPSSQVASAPRSVSYGGAPPPRPPFPAHPWVPPTLTLAARRSGARQVRRPRGQGCGRRHVPLQGVSQGEGGWEGSGCCHPPAAPSLVPEAPSVTPIPTPPSMAPSLITGAPSGIPRSICSDPPQRLPVQSQRHPVGSPMAPSLIPRSSYSDPPLHVTQSRPSGTQSHPP